jgi:hypothetical protein
MSGTSPAFEPLPIVVVGDDVVEVDGTLAGGATEDGSEGDGIEEGGVSSTVVTGEAFVCCFAATLTHRRFAPFPEQTTVLLAAAPLSIAEHAKHSATAAITMEIRLISRILVRV